MSGLIRDLVHAWRGLTQRPGFFAGALVTVALGIGANVAIFSLVNAISLRPMPFGDRTDRLATIHIDHRLNVDEPGWGDTEISFRDFLDFRAASTVEGIGGYMSRAFLMNGAGDAGAERLRGGSVTPDLFPLLGIEPILGRQFREDEAAPPGLESVVMLTHNLWQRRFGGDPAIIGKPIIVNDRARVVVGVLPEGFRFPEFDDMYVPFRWEQAPRSARNINAVALVRPGQTIDRARAELSAIAKRLEETYPETNRGYGVRVIPIRGSYIGAGDRQLTMVLMSAVGFVLLIMCANLANLMLVRGAARQRELAVRAAMGAGQGRLLWATVAETLWLAVPGTAIGLLLAQWMIDALMAALGQSLPYWVDVSIDVRVVAFAIASALFTTFVVGVLPALRTVRPHLVNDLKEGGRGVSLGPAGQRLQAGLVVAQVALCFALLVGANLMVQSFLAMQRASLGFDHSQVLTSSAYLAGDAYDDVRDRAVFYRKVVDTIQAVPGVATAAITTATPGDDGGQGQQLVIDGRTSAAEAIGVQSIATTAGLFDTIDLPLLDGRTFTDAEVLDPRADVALVNQELARRLWPGDSAVGRRIGFRVNDEIRWLRVVGVAPNVHYEEIGEDTEQSRLNVYVPLATSGTRVIAMLIRAQEKAESVAAPLAATLRRMAPTFAVAAVLPMNEVRARTTWEQEFFGDLMAVFAGGALLLACLGIYALISYSVGRRSHEIGVRLALGARPADVIRMLLEQTARVGGAGLLAGLVLAIAVARTLAGGLYGVKVDPWLFASMAVPLTLALLIATWVPARRAARVEPTIALRDE